MNTVAFRLDKATCVRLEQLADRLPIASKSAIVREALSRGLDQLELAAHALMRPAEEGSKP